MDKAARKRWAVLLTALSLTVAAIFFSPAPAEVVEADVARKPAVSAAVPAQVVQPAPTDIAPVFAAEGAADPFEPRSWGEPAPEPVAPPPPPPPVERTVVPVVLEAGPAPLPYRYVGRFSDEAGGVVYLARGEVALVARVGETIDGTYKVAALQARSVEFENISTGTKQSLPIPEAE